MSTIYDLNYGENKFSVEPFVKKFNHKIGFWNKIYICRSNINFDIIWNLNLWFLFIYIGVIFNYKIRG